MSDILLEHAQNAHKAFKMEWRYLAFLQVSAGIEILESMETSGCGGIPPLHHKAAAQLYGMMSLLARYFPGYYDASRCADKAVDLLQDLYQATAKECYKRQRSEVVAQCLQPRPPLPVKEELAHYRRTGLVLESYDIFQDENDNLCIGISRNKPLCEQNDKPLIYYDGGLHALLVVNNSFLVVLDYLHPEVHELFLHAIRVLVARFDKSGKPQEEFYATIHLVKGLGCLCKAWVEPKK